MSKTKTENHAQNEIVDFYNGNIIQLWENNKEKTMVLRMFNTSITLDKKVSRKFFNELRHAIYEMELRT